MASTGGGGCSKDTPKLGAEELQTAVQGLPNWRVDAGGATISRSFVAKNFASALAFFQRAGEVAEAANHHPDLHLTNYRDVQVVLSTHAIGGVSQIDLDVAARLDELPCEYSPKWLKQQQQQQQTS